MLNEVVVSTSYIAEFSEAVGDMMLKLLRSGINITIVNIDRLPWKNDAR